MRLKIATTTSLVFGLAMLAAWPWVVGNKPPSDAPTADLRMFATRMVFYMTFILITFMSTMLFAYLLIRQEQKKLIEISQSNLKDLIEGTLQDHGKPKS